MCNKTFICFLLLFANIQLFSQGDIEIINLTGNSLDVASGSAVNIALKIINNSKQAEQIQLKVTTPDGISTISDYNSFDIEPERKKIKILSLYTEKNTKIGEKSIKIEAFNKKTTGKICEFKIEFNILPNYNVKASFIKKPEFVFAGDSVNIIFSITNTSNTESNINFSITNINIVDSKKIKLDSGEDKLINILFATNKDITKSTRQSLTVRYSMEEDSTQSGEISTLYDIIPSQHKKTDKYYRLPVKLTGLFVTNNQTGPQRYGYMFDVSGGGVFSKRKNRSIVFHLRGPNQQGNPIMGQTDHYEVGYSSRKTSVIAGDQTFSLTELTEGSRMGRGINVQQRFNKLAVGSFINLPRFYPSLSRVIGAYSLFQINDKSRISLGFLNKAFKNDTSANLFSLSGSAVPTKWSEISLEFAGGLSNGKFTYAYSSEVRLKLKQHRLFMNYIWAGEDFPGYLTNSKYLISGLSTSFKKFNFNVNFNMNHRNMALDTMFQNAPFSNSLITNLGYSFNYLHSINIGFLMRSTEDMNPVKQFYYKETQAVIGFRSRIKRFVINFNGSLGKTVNFLDTLDSGPSNSYNTNLKLNYQFFNNLNLSVFVNYLRGNYYLTPDYNHLFYGGFVDVALGKNLKFLLSYQNNYRIEDYYKDRSLFSLDAAYFFLGHHELAIGIDYDLRKNSLNKTVINANVRYAYTINVPVAKRDDIGTLSGVIVNKGVSTVEGVIINFAGSTAISDKDGKFSFPNIEKGHYYVYLNKAVTGLNTISEIPLPMMVEILPGEITYIEIPITKAADIKGKIIIEQENLNSRRAITAKDEIDKLIIEVNNGKETFRVYTDDDMGFLFNDLRPGKWKLIVYPTGIPDGYLLLNKEIDLNLLSGQTREVEIRIKKKNRMIKFQK